MLPVRGGLESGVVEQAGVGGGDVGLLDELERDPMEKPESGGAGRGVEGEAHRKDPEKVARFIQSVRAAESPE